MEANQLRASNSAHLDKSTEAARSFAKIKWRQVSSLLEVAISGGHSKSLGAAPSCKDVQVVVQQVEWRSDVRKSRGEGAYTMLPEETDPQQHHMQDFAALGYDFCDGPSSDDPCCVTALCARRETLQNKNSANSQNSRNETTCATVGFQVAKWMDRQ